jgi:GNAT superfamily N-acetyltransferase
MYTANRKSFWGDTMSNTELPSTDTIRPINKSKVVNLPARVGASIILEVKTTRRPRATRNAYSNYFSVWESEATIHLPGMHKEIGNISIKVHDLTENGIWLHSVKEINDEFYWALDNCSQCDSDMADAIIRCRNLLAASLAVGGICAIDRIEVNPEHRGNGYGMTALRTLLRWYTTNYGVATGFLKAFPLQFEGTAYESSTIKKGFLSAKKRLHNLYAAKLGAVVINREGFMRVDMVETMGCMRADLIERKSRAQSTRRARDLVNLIEGRMYGLY